MAKMIRHVKYYRSGISHSGGSATYVYEPYVRCFCGNCGSWVANGSEGCWNCDLIFDEIETELIED